MEGKHLELYLLGDVQAVQRALDTIADRRQRTEARVTQRRGPAGGLLHIPLDLPEPAAVAYIERALQICKELRVTCTDRLDGRASMDPVEAWRELRTRHEARDTLDDADASLHGRSRADAPDAAHDYRPFWNAQRVLFAAAASAAAVILTAAYLAGSCG